jgi:gamma-polyglutamate biosynthesis protein CapC
VLTASLIIGVVVSLLMVEVTGLNPGGVIVPGYVALILDRPVELLVLLALALLTFALVRLLAELVMLYGTRRFAITLLVGLGLGTGTRALRLHAPGLPLEWAGLGYIVPGLVAYHFDRQGVLPTLLALAVAAPLTRLGTLVMLSW